MKFAIDIFTVVMVSSGVVFFMAGTVGLLRFPDTLTRLHALTKVDNLDFQAPDAFKEGQYFSANLLWNPDSHILMGVEYLWGRREVVIPAAAVARVENDLVTLSVTKDEVGALATRHVHRWF